MILFNTRKLCGGLATGLFLGLVVQPPGAERLVGQESAPAATRDEGIQPSDATLLTAKTVFVEPMSQGFDKFLVAELSRTKNLFAVTSQRAEADLWMKGAVMIMETGAAASAELKLSDLARSERTVSGRATVVLVARGQNQVLWQGEAELIAVPGTHIPQMSKVLIAKLRKSVKEARKGLKAPAGNP